MHYIILDLEWDSGYCPQHHRFLNQILQIGAIKLNASLEIVDSFEETIRSSFTKRVTGRFSTLTGITTQQMLAGIPLSEAVDRYNAWIGDDTVTMSWSNSDLFAIAENENFLLQDRRFKIEKYIDLQKFIQNEMRLQGMECNSQISLANCAEQFGISTDSFDLHTAKDDSLVCVALLQKNYNAERFAALVEDTRNPEFYRKLFYKPSFVDDISDPCIDRSELKFRCEACGGDAKRTTKWRYHNRWFTAEFRCKSCENHFLGRVSFRKMYDSVVVKRRVAEVKKAKSEAASDDMQPVSAEVRQ